MYGAYIGDIVGSKYEFNNIKTKDFPLYSRGCDFTDDSIMTAAVAKAIMLSAEERRKNRKKTIYDFFVDEMQAFGRKYPYPTGAYGTKFSVWLRQKDPSPYGSCGNGSAMRASPCGLIAVTLDEAKALARASAVVSHDHPEGIKGAEAAAVAVFLAKSGKTKEEIRQYIEANYYDLSFTLDSIRPVYRFDATCQGSVPQAIVSFLESTDFEDAVRNVISIGGDCDTTGAVTSSIAWAYYDDASNPSKAKLKSEALSYLPKDLIDVADDFKLLCGQRSSDFERTGECAAIMTDEEESYYLNNPEL